MTKKMTNEIKTVISKKMASATTWEELKSVYVEYATEYTTAAAIKYIDRTFESFAPAVYEKHKTMDGKSYTKTPAETSGDFRALIAELIKLSGVTVEVCGTWMYIHGTNKDDKAMREKLKSLGFFWCSGKKCWGKKPKGYRGSSRGKHWSMSKIRETYGQKVITEPEEL